MVAGYAAGFVDAVVGGGGLIQLPAIALLLPKAAGDVVLGSNKFAAALGTGAAAHTYRRRLPAGLRLDRHLVLPALAVAALGSFVGARITSSIPTRVVRPGIVVLLAAMVIATWRRPDLGQRVTGIASPSRVKLLVLAAAVGLYDGLFGPGTGMLFTFGLVAWVGLDFLTATATTKILNLGTNLAALVWFVPHNAVHWALAIPIGLCNLAGGLTGSRVALAGGTKLVRRAFLAIATAFIIKLLFDLR
jgi:uncharacterized membrane protein YfcA